ncbi:MAG: hypothetical protein WCV50_05125 [Patescibacteria group bacterium]|jgi:hypothetical protein
MEQEKTPIFNDKKEQRLRKQGLLLLSVIALLSVGFGGWYIIWQLNSPFEIKKIANSENSEANFSVNADELGINTNSLAALENLRDKDTDQDGLSDYDELYVFGTSPYLSDSDSDKISDKIEIDQGSDPNCPQGTACGNETNSNTSSTNSSNTNSGFLTDLKPTNTNSVYGNLTTQQLRDVLLNAGVPEDSLNQLDDETLIATYQQILEEEGGNANTNSATNTNTQDTGGVTYEQLANLTIAEIRSLLVQNGVPEDTLNQLDDATLKQIYLESLAQNFQTQ